LAQTAKGLSPSGADGDGRQEREDGGTVHEQVVNALFGMLRSGSYQVGDRLPGELTLVEVLGVGRSAVREAIRELVALDVLEARRGKGTFVRSQRPDLLISADYLRNDAIQGMRRELQEVRWIVEPEVAALAAERASEADMAHLEVGIERLEAAVVAREYAPEGIGFHLELARAARNRALFRVIEAVTGFHTLGQLATSDDVIGHRAVLAALRDHDADGARAAMKDHLTTVEAGVPSASYVLWSGSADR
jgi:DNA-binding FadR family transcriptional regulator